MTGIQRCDNRAYKPLHYINSLVLLCSSLLCFPFYQSRAKEDTRFCFLPFRQPPSFSLNTGVEFCWCYFSSASGSVSLTYYRICPKRYWIKWFCPPGKNVLSCYIKNSIQTVKWLVQPRGGHFNLKSTLSYVVDRNSLSSMRQIITTVDPFLLSAVLLYVTFFLVSLNEWQSIPPNLSLHTNTIAVLTFSESWVLQTYWQMKVTWSLLVSHDTGKVTGLIPQCGTSVTRYCCSHIT